MPSAASGRAGVEAGPSEPQDAGADHRQRQAVRRHRPFGIATPDTEDDHHRQRRGTGVDVHHRAAGEVERTHARRATRRRRPCGRSGAYTRTSQTEMKTAYAENFRRSAVAPVINAGVMIANVIWNAQNSTNGMVEEREEVVGLRLAEQCGPDVLHPGELEVADEPSVAGVAERQAEDHGDPEHAEDAHREEVLHEHAEHVLAADHAPVEEGEAWRHEQDQCGGCQHPGGVSGIHASSSSSPSGQLTDSCQLVSAAFLPAFIRVNYAAGSTERTARIPQWISAHPDPATLPGLPSGLGGHGGGWRTWIGCDGAGAWRAPRCGDGERRGGRVAAAARPRHGRTRSTSGPPRSRRCSRWRRRPIRARCAPSTTIASSTRTSTSRSPWRTTRPAASVPAPPTCTSR